jgi:hypothetical protein
MLVQRSLRGREARLAARADARRADASSLFSSRKNMLETFFQREF